MTSALSFRDDPERALAAYRADGYFLERDLFTAVECEALIAAGTGLETARAGVVRPAMNPHRDEPRFFAAMADRRLTTIMERLCGGVVSGLQSEFFYGRPSTPGFAPHQDNFFVEAPDDAFASAWLALVDVSPENGGLILYPGSHKAGKLETEALDSTPSPYQDPNAASRRALVPPACAPADLHIPRGSVVLLHGWVAHASHDNDSDGWRYALLNTYIRKGAPFRPGNYAGRKEVDLAAGAAA
jgi:ectoine hydroxylase-related dioxygenase (phytanoyl-CoA dioxygenase family)